jgi:hypothetical protein
MTSSSFIVLQITLSKKLPPLKLPEIEDFNALRETYYVSYFEKCLKYPLAPALKRDQAARGFPGAA